MSDRNWQGHAIHPAAPVNAPNWAKITTNSAAIATPAIAGRILVCNGPLVAVVRPKNAITEIEVTAISPGTPNAPSKVKQKSGRIGQGRQPRHQFIDAHAIGHQPCGKHVKHPDQDDRDIGRGGR